MDHTDAYEPTRGDDGSDVVAPADASFLPPQWKEKPAPEGSETSGRSSASMVPVWAPVNPGVATDDVVTAPVPRGPGWRWALVSLVAALIGALIGGGIVASVANGNSNSSTT